MDKLKVILAVLQKYHFWAACVLVLLVAVVCWWAATAGLAGQFQKRKSELETKFSGAERIRQNDPNDKVVEAIRDEEQTLKEQVWKAWEILYNEQKEKNPFPKVLGEGFKRQFENLKPGEDLPRKYREDYQNYIMKYLPVLLDEVEILRSVETEREAPAVGGNARPGAGPARGMPGMPGPGLGGRTPRGGATESEPQWTGIVDWNENNIRQLESRFVWDTTPSTMEVLLAQEDLWVIGALLRVIARTNEGASGPAAAAVKRIEALEIGREAASDSSASETPIFQPGAAGGGGRMSPGGVEGMRGGMGPMPGRMGPMGGGGMERTSPGSMGDRMGRGGPGGATSDVNALFAGRYVDNKDMPLSAKSEYPYAQHPYAEFKMMPIRMNLVMDQRRLPKLLVECANSSMPVEVRRVRVMKGKDGAVRSNTGRGLGGLGMPGMGREGGVRAQDAPTETGVNDVPVEIYGRIYIYNPPDRKKLGTGAASQDNPVEPSAANGPEPPGSELPAAARNP